MNDGDIKVIAKQILIEILKERQSQFDQVFLCQVQVHKHLLATRHFDERCRRKESESFLSQPEHTIWVSNTEL